MPIMTLCNVCDKLENYMLYGLRETQKLLIKGMVYNLK